MKAITNKNQITQTELDNLTRLREFNEYYGSLIPYSKSINKLFYMHIQICLHKSEDIIIDQGDVDIVFEVIKFLESIKQYKPDQEQKELTQEDIENLDALRELLGLYESFDVIIKSINELFYTYIQTCIHKDYDIMINQADVYNILKVVNFFLSIKTPLVI